MIVWRKDSNCVLQTGRIAEVDIAKGVLAMLVAVGHAVQQYGVSLRLCWEVVRNVIYSFHMAAFVVVWQDGFRCFGSGSLRHSMLCAVVRLDVIKELLTCRMTE